MKIGLVCSGVLVYSPEFTSTWGRAYIQIMPKPLTQKTCGFCAKTYTTKVNLRGVLCPICAEDSAIMRYHAEHEYDFFVKIYAGKDVSSNLYQATFNAPYEIGKNLSTGTLIGYVSRATGIFFIGRVVIGVEDAVWVKPNKRLCGPMFHDNHKVPFEDISCLFRFKGGK